ncbi:hypothetical protein Tcan_01172, partial [Toxocara canis]
MCEYTGHLTTAYFKCKRVKHGKEFVLSRITVSTCCRTPADLRQRRANRLAGERTDSFECAAVNEAILCSLYANKSEMYSLKRKKQKRTRHKRIGLDEVRKMVSSKM